MSHVPDAHYATRTGDVFIYFASLRRGNKIAAIESMNRTIREKKKKNSDPRLIRGTAFPRTSREKYFQDRKVTL